MFTNWFGNRKSESVGEDGEKEKEKETAMSTSNSVNQKPIGSNTVDSFLDRKLRDSGYIRSFEDLVGFNPYDSYYQRDQFDLVGSPWARRLKRAECILNSSAVFNGSSTNTVGGLFNTVTGRNSLSQEASVTNAQLNRERFQLDPQLKTDVLDALASDSTSLNEFLDAGTVEGGLERILTGNRLSCNNMTKSTRQRLTNVILGGGNGSSKSSDNNGKSRNIMNGGSFRTNKRTRSMCSLCLYAPYKAPFILSNELMNLYYDGYLTCVWSCTTSKIALLIDTTILILTTMNLFMVPFIVVFLRLDASDRMNENLDSSSNGSGPGPSILPRYTSAADDSKSYTYAISTSNKMLTSYTLSLDPNEYDSSGVTYQNIFNLSKNPKAPLFIIDLLVIDALYLILSLLRLNVSILDLDKSCEIMKRGRIMVARLYN